MPLETLYPIYSQDIQKAREAGYDDTEIEVHLKSITATSKTPFLKYTYPDYEKEIDTAKNYGYNDDEIETQLKAVSKPKELNLSPYPQLPEIDLAIPDKKPSLLPSHAKTPIPQPAHKPIEPLIKPKPKPEGLLGTLEDIYTSPLAETGIGIGKIGETALGQATPEKIIKTAGTGAIVTGIGAGFAIAPVGTAGGLALFTALDKLKSLALSKVTGKEIESLSDLLPEEATQLEKDFFDGLDIIGTGLATGFAGKGISGIGKKIVGAVIDKLPNIFKKAYINKIHLENVKAGKESLDNSKISLQPEEGSVEVPVKEVIEAKAKTGYKKPVLKPLSEKPPISEPIPKPAEIPTEGIGKPKPAWEMTREELGELYHGGKRKIKNVDFSKLQQRDKGFYGEGFYVTKSPEYAKGYGKTINKVSLSNEAKILNASLKPEDAPQGLMDEIINNYYNKSITKAKKLGKEKLLQDEINDIKTNFLNWKNEVYNYAIDKGYNVVKYSDGEIVILKRQALSEGKPVPQGIPLTAYHPEGKPTPLTTPAKADKRLDLTINQIVNKHEPDPDIVKFSGKGFTEYKEGLKAQVKKKLIEEPEFERKIFQSLANSTLGRDFPDNDLIRMFPGAFKRDKTGYGNFDKNVHSLLLDRDLGGIARGMGIEDTSSAYEWLKDYGMKGRSLKGKVNKAFKDILDEEKRLYDQYLTEEVVEGKSPEELRVEKLRREGKGLQAGLFGGEEVTPLKEKPSEELPLFTGKPEEGKIIEPAIEEKNLTELMDFFEEAPKKEPISAEGGFIKVGSKIPDEPDITKLKSRNIKFFDYILNILHVGDRNPLLKDILTKSVDAQLLTEGRQEKQIERLTDIFNKVEDKTLIGKAAEYVFGKRGTGIKGIPEMIEKKKPIPANLQGLISDIRNFLGEYKGRVIERKIKDIASHITPAQQKYLSYLRGETTEEPTRMLYGKVKKPVMEATKAAAQAAFEAIEEAKNWGVLDYFPRSFIGQYKYLIKSGEHAGDIIAAGETAKQAKMNLLEKITERPELANEKFVVTVGLYETSSARKVLKPEAENPLAHLGTQLSRKQYFALENEIKGLIKDEVEKAGGMAVKGLDIDLSGIASIRPSGKFSPFLLKRKTELKGQEPDAFKTLASYVFSMERKLGLEDTKKEMIKFADDLPLNMKRTADFIRGLAQRMSGKYSTADKLFDEYLGQKIGMKPFGITRVAKTIQSFEAKSKLGYSPTKAAVNRLGGALHTAIQAIKDFKPVEVKEILQGKQFSRTPKGKALYDKVSSLVGGQHISAVTGGRAISKKDIQLWRPMGLYQRQEIFKNRPEAVGVFYIQGLRLFKGDKALAEQYAIDNTQVTQGLYNLSSLSYIISGPLSKLAFQFKPYLMNEIRYINQLNSKQFWLLYVPTMSALMGTKGVMMMLRPLFTLGFLFGGMNLYNKINDAMNRKASALHRGIPGATLDIDISAPLAWQLPTGLLDWAGATTKDVASTIQMGYELGRKGGWTPEEVERYWRGLAPQLVNFYNAYQLAKTGKIRQGTKTLYKSEKPLTEALKLTLGATPEKLAYERDLARSMIGERGLAIDKYELLLNDYLSAIEEGKTKDANKLFSQMLKAKGVGTEKDFNLFISNLLKTIEERRKTKSERIFKRLPKPLKEEYKETTP